MPRHSDVKNMRPSQKEKYKQVQRTLGEDSGSFRSASTDEYATDYNLEYSSRRGRKLQPARSPKKSTQETSPKRHTRSSSHRMHDHSSSVAGPSTSHNARSPGRQSGSARRKNKKPKKHVFNEIRRLQNTANQLLPRLPFSRLIREILQTYSFEGLRVTPTALQALQESAEIYLTTLFTDAYRCTLHRGRVTLLIKDMELVRYLRGRDDPGNL